MLVVVLQSNPSGAASSTLYVVQGGSDTGTCSSTTTPCATITYALTQATSGDTIEVAGTIYDRVVVPASFTSLTISGADAPASAPAIVNGYTNGEAPPGSVFVIKGTATLDGLTITEGSGTASGDAYLGGGVLNEGTLTIANSTITDNLVGGVDTFGGGISNEGTITVAGSTVSDNGAVEGGGIDNGGTMTVTDSTISGNGTIEPEPGGGVFNGGTLAISDSTISGNRALNDQDGAAIYNEGSSSVGATIIAGNNGGSNCAGTPSVSVGYNLTDDATGAECGFARSTDLVNVNPELGPLADNGGPTQTMLPPNQSPAVGVIPLGTTVNGVSVCPSADQRGVARPQPPGASFCSIGAVEVAPAAVAPAITSANNVSFTMGRAGTFTVTSTGKPTASLSETGSLPSGVSFTDNGNATATLAGTPAAGTGGVYPLILTASNGVLPNATQAFTLIVGTAPVIISVDATAFTLGKPGSFQMTASGSPAPTFTKTGALPTGVTFNSAGVLSGTPTVSGTFPLTITASNGVKPPATQAFTLTVGTAPIITSGNASTFAVGTAGSFTVVSNGIPTPALSESGALPKGVSFTDNGNATATLAGTPAAGTGGVYPFTISATNALGTATQAFTLMVKQPPIITSADTTIFAQGQAGSFTITTSAYPSANPIKVIGTLPSGVSFTNHGNGTATLAGTPAPHTSGTYDLTFTATNGLLPNASQAFILEVPGTAKLATTTTLKVSKNPAKVNQAVTYTASVTLLLGSTPATGTVAITGCGTKTLTNGQATCTRSYTTAGTKSVTAKYQGNATNAKSTSNTINEKIKS